MCLFSEIVLNVMCPILVESKVAQLVKIIDLKCMMISDLRALIVRVDTDEGVSGLAQVEATKFHYLKPHILFYKPYLLEQDPRDVERVMLRIRRFGSFKPWGSSVSAIEMALWDIAGKAAGVPVHRLLGGRIRDRVRVYNGGVRPPMKGVSPPDYAENAREILKAPEGFTIMKWGIGFHSPMSQAPGYHYGEEPPGPRQAYIYRRGHVTEKGLKQTVSCVKALKDVLGDEIGLALDCGPGWTVPAAIQLARALEPMNVMWLEDLLTGDYTPYTLPEAYRLVTRSTSTPIHTGEQVYLRQGFQGLIEKNAVSIVGPDPCDVGGIAELKWIAEYADMHGVLVAPHGVFDGPIGLAALVQASSTLPENYIAFEYPQIDPRWHSLVTGLPNLKVRNGFIDVPMGPGLGVNLNEKAVRKHLREGETYFE
jgi:L-alanine-DL-glutamate epimerase-like enolase superfamily enzyme